MPLYKLEDFDRDYRETFGGDDVKGLDVNTIGGMKVGTVADVLVDNDGRFRYLVIDSNYNGSGKRILLPIGLSRINYNTKQVTVDGLSREQVQRLPEYNDSMTVDSDYEEQVRQAYRPTASGTGYNRDSYSYQQEPSLYGLNEQDHQTFRLYEERLVANKSRIKTGEVTVGKHVERETARVSVPIEKERVIIERVPPTRASAAISTGEIKFQEGEIARIEVYEEAPAIYKEAFVREEVRVKKVVERETVEAEDVIRREELDVNTEGNFNVNQSDLNAV